MSRIEKLAQGIAFFVCNPADGIEKAEEFIYSALMMALWELLIRRFYEIIQKIYERRIRL